MDVVYDLMLIVAGVSAGNFIYDILMTQYYKWRYYYND